MTAQPNGTDLASLPVGHIAATMPGAAAVFIQHGVDFCCGGDQRLAEAAAARNLDLATVIAELGEWTDAADQAWNDAETPVMIEHIKIRYHETHLRELPTLIQLARKVEAAHKNNAVVPAGLGDLLSRLFAEIRVHQQREEIVLFPMLLRGGDPMAASAIATMRAEHDDHGAALTEIDRLTHGRTVPPDGCATWNALCTGLTKLYEDMIMHVHLENNILFPRFEPPKA
ncbi:MAG TPA: DUF542 domain-containing protein [Acidiphilium sp.]